MSTLVNANFSLWPKTSRTSSKLPDAYVDLDIEDASSDSVNASSILNS